MQFWFSNRFSRGFHSIGAGVLLLSWDAFFSPWPPPRPNPRPWLALHPRPPLRSQRPLCIRLPWPQLPRPLLPPQKYTRLALLQWLMTENHLHLICQSQTNLVLSIYHLQYLLVNDDTKKDDVKPENIYWKGKNLNRLTSSLSLSFSLSVSKAAILWKAPGKYVMSESIWTLDWTNSDWHHHLHSPLSHLQTQ